MLLPKIACYAHNSYLAGEEEEEEENEPLIGLALCTCKQLPLSIGHLFELLNSLGKVAAEHFFGPFCNSKNELIGSMEPLCQNCKILQASKVAS